MDEIRIEEANRRGEIIKLCSRLHGVASQDDGKFKSIVVRYDFEGVVDKYWWVTTVSDCTSEVGQNGHRLQRKKSAISGVLSKVDRFYSHLLP